MRDVGLPGPGVGVKTALLRIKGAPMKRLATAVLTLLILLGPAAADRRFLSAQDYLFAPEHSRVLYVNRLLQQLGEMTELANDIHVRENLVHLRRCAEARQQGDMEKMLTDYLMDRPQDWTAAASGAFVMALSETCPE